MTVKDHPYREKITLFTFLIATVLVIVVSLRMTAPFFLAIIMAAIMAIITQTAFQQLTARHIWPKAASAILTFGLLFLVVAPISWFVTVAIKQGIAISQAVATNEHFSPQAMINHISQWRFLEVMGFSAEDISTRVHGWLQEAAKWGTFTAVHTVGNLPNIILQIAVASIAYFFLLMDGRRFLTWLGKRIPFDKNVSNRVATSFKNTAIATIWATIAAGSAQGMILFLAYVILGVPGAFLAGGATFIFAWIPLVGTTPVWVAGAVYLYVHGLTGKLVAMVILGLLASVVDNFIRPLVLKGRSHMHPLVTLVAIFGGLSFFGIIGVFLGPILVAVVSALLQAWPEVADRFGIMSKD